jgi:hypothetical protein
MRRRGPEHVPGSSGRACRRRAHAAVAAALLAGVPRTALAEGLPAPLAWQEPSPVSRLFLQLPFEPPEPLPPGRLRPEVRVIYSNSLLLGATPALRLVADVETVQPTLSLAAGLGAGLEARVALPLVVDWGGLLDRPTEAVDGFFHSPLGERHSRPDDSAQWTLVRADGRGVSRTGAGAGLGDASIGLKGRLLDGGGWIPALSARAALSLPTGRPPWGAGALTPAAGLLAGWRVGSAALRLAADLAVPTARLRSMELSTRPYGTLNLGVTAPASSRLALQLQASAHSAPLRATGIDRLDRPTAYVLFGVSARLPRETVLDVGVAENVFSPYRGADISLLLALHGA